MTLIKWDPFRNIASLQGRINRLFEDAFPGTQPVEENAVSCSWRPSVDIYEEEDAIVVNAEIPGISKEDVSIEVKDNILTITGERKMNSAIQEENYYRRERCFGFFHRAFALPSMIDPQKIKASFKDGVLQIRVPKPEEKKTKRVPIDII